MRETPGEIGPSDENRRVAEELDRRANRESFRASVSLDPFPGTTESVSRDVGRDSRKPLSGRMEAAYEERAL